MRPQRLDFDDDEDEDEYLFKPVGIASLESGNGKYHYQYCCSSATIVLQSLLQSPDILWVSLAPF